MRSVRDERETNVDIHFDCAIQARVLRQAPGTRALRAVEYCATVHKPVLGSLSVPYDKNVLVINKEGSCIAYLPGAVRPALIAPGSLIFARGDSRVTVQAARGEHNAVVLSWPAAFIPAIELLYQTWGLANLRDLSCHPIAPTFERPFSEIESAIGIGNGFADLRLAGLVQQVVADLLSLPNESQLAPLPGLLPEPIVELTRAVRASAAQSWALKDASERAGYSPYHFSRVFKSLVGYGFHEFVDRCRTENAIEMLTCTSKPVDLVATSCGFGTTQALRESIKEYVGLVPSEIRNLRARAKI